MTNRTAAGNAADVVSDSPTRRGINIYSSVNAPVVAVNDGVITALGENAKLGHFIILTDAYGNRYTYAGLGAIADSHPVPKENALTAADFKLESPKGSDQDRPRAIPPPPAATIRPQGLPPNRGRSAAAPANTEELRDRLFALPERPANVGQASVSGQLDSLLGERVPAYETFKSYFNDVFKFDAKTMELKPLKVGSKVTGGTVLGQIGDSAQTGTKGAPHLNFAIRPAGRGAPKIDPKPILDGWKLLETTAIYRASGQDPFGSDASIGQILLMSKEVLAQRALADPRLQIYSCGRTDIESGQIDRRTLAVLEYLAERGYRLTVTSLKCGHSFYTTSGNVSAHSSGNAVDIAAVNGIPIIGNQGPGSVTEAVIRDLLKLQGTMRPAQIISLMEMGAPTFAMGDHADHIHVGFTPLVRSGPAVRPARPGPEARAVGAADRPPRRDREPGGAPEALRRLAPGRRPAPAAPTRASNGSGHSPSSSSPAGSAFPKAATSPARAQIERVLIVETIGAPRPSRRRRRRPRQVDPGEPGEVPVTRVTVTGAEELADPEQASAWLESVAGDARRRAAEVRSATARRQPRPPCASCRRRRSRWSPTSPRPGRWRSGSATAAARSSPRAAGPRPGSCRPRSGGGYEEVEPQSRVAAVLAGRDRVHPAETMLLRARLDAEQGREDEARYGLAAAEAALERDPGPREQKVREASRRAPRAPRRSESVRPSCAS